MLYFIHQDISNELLAKELAAIAAYSEQHFHRLFKGIVGEPVHHYIRRTRMEFAANQLMFDAKSSVLNIATKSGFSSVSSFSRAFKSTFEMSLGCRHQAIKCYRHLLMFITKKINFYLKMNALN